MYLVRILLHGGSPQSSLSVFALNHAAAHGAGSRSPSAICYNACIQRPPHRTQPPPLRAPSIFVLVHLTVQAPWASRSSTTERDSDASLSRIHGPISNETHTIWALHAALPRFGAHFIERPRRSASDHSMTSVDL